MSVGVANPKVLAGELNKFMVGRGGEEIPGLEGLDPKKLIQLRDGLKGFLDKFDQAASQNPALAGLAGSEALRSMRELAQVASQKVDEAAVGGGAAKAGFCGGGGGQVQQPPARPPVVAPEAPNQDGGNVVTGPLAANGANFDPLAVNACVAAALVASTCGAGSLGVARPNGNVGALGAGGNAAQRVPADSGSDPNLDALQGAGGGGGCFEDRVFGLMIKIVEDMQKKIEERLKKLEEDAKKAEEGGGKGGGKGGGIGGMLGGVVGSAVGGPIGGMVGKAAGGAIGGAAGGGGGGGGGGGDGGKESRNIEFEKIKFDMQKLSQMQQALSNILNTMDELAKSAIRHIKAG